MTRAALTTNCGDPFILLLLIKLWQDRWHDEVNTLWINVNNHVLAPTEVEGELLSVLVKDPKIHLIYHPLGIHNGPPFVELIKLMKEDLVLMLEDDFYIFTPGVVDEYFQKIESGEVDIIGSVRYSVGEVAEAAQKKYNLDYSGSGDRGFGWWPTGFFCKRDLLLKTDLDFGSKKYPKGEYFKELDHTFAEEAATDTFTWLSLQLRYLGAKSLDIPHFHASPDEAIEKEKRQINWAGPRPRYIHGGSLSSGWRGYLNEFTPDVSHDLAKKEIETRVAFWKIASDVVPGFTDFKARYREGIENLIVKTDLDRMRIDRKYNIYRELMRI